MILVDMSEELDTTTNWKQFRALVRAADTAKAKDAAALAARDELRVFLRDNPNTWRVMGDLARHARDALLARTVTNCPPSVAASVQEGLDAMRAELRHPGDGQLEALLIDQVLICWLDESLTRMAYATAQHELSNDGAELWQRKLSMTQARYLRALETLARVRKLIRQTVQINIAQPGAQQVNVAGDVVTPG